MFQKLTAKVALSTLVLQLFLPFMFSQAFAAGEIVYDNGKRRFGNG
jgi:hypothetical protein